MKLPLSYTNLNEKIPEFKTLGRLKSWVKKNNLIVLGIRHKGTLKTHPTRYLRGYFITKKDRIRIRKEEREN